MFLFGESLQIFFVQPVVYLFISDVCLWRRGENWTFCFVLRSKSERASDSGESDNNNNTGEEGGEEAEEEDDEYDEEYVPEWHEDYDEDDIDEDDFFSDDDESENLERDFSPFDWTRWKNKKLPEKEDESGPAPSSRPSDANRERQDGRETIRGTSSFTWTPPPMHSCTRFSTSCILPSVFS